jgi:hypothetical protein
MVDIAKAAAHFLLLENLRMLPRQIAEGTRNGTAGDTRSNL